MKKSNTLNEGEIYSFLIEKIITLPDGEECYRLLDPFKKKHLIPVDIYQEYGFRSGANVLCRVDKVNCNGRIFLEPINPIYEEGKSYSFLIRHSVPIDDIASFFLVELEDDFDGKHILIADKAEGFLECKVLRIRKGKLELVFTSLDYEIFKSFDYVDTIIHSIIEFQNQNYIILKVNDEYYNVLNEKNYDFHFFTVGNNQVCLVKKDPLYQYIALEPDHMVYNVGENYDFSVVRVDKFDDVHRGVKKFLIVQDEFGQYASIKLDNNSQHVHKPGSVIKCKLATLRKGKLILELFQ
jgi:hypothetical protein